LILERETNFTFYLMSKPVISRETQPAMPLTVARLKLRSMGSMIALTVLSEREPHLQREIVLCHGLITFARAGFERSTIEDRYFATAAFDCA
jgi:hypothetical protein